MLAHYRLVEKIGEGGMGVVWKALDTTLDREVAVKILPDEFAGQPERLARFEREAKLLASLNHPHIAAIYGIHESEGRRFLAMELVPGEDLSQRLSRGPVPVGEALPVALQMATALEAAHESGVIHRDLKPANIKLAGGASPASTTTGSDAPGSTLAASGPGATASAATIGGAGVKILDFGLAKAMEESSPSPDVTQSPTLTLAATQAGVILGTAAYMSPEQARGHAADRRADIWAFGVVLFEMLAGRRLFSGDTVSDTLAAVLRADPDFDDLPATTSPASRRLLTRCLDKDPRRRLQSMGEARIALEDILSGREETREVTTVAAAPPPRRLSPVSLFAGLVVGAVLATATFWALNPAPPEPPLRKIVLPLQGDDSGLNAEPVISPDGSQIVFRSGRALWVRRLDQWESRELDGTEDAESPFWSPDSLWLGYGKDGKLWKYSIGGGQATALCDLPTDFGAGTWLPDGTILFAPNAGPMYAVSEKGGDPKVYLDIEEGKVSDFHEPGILPDGRGLVTVVHRRPEGADTIDLVVGGQRRTLLQLPETWLGYPSYAPTGHLLYERTRSNDGIWAVPFSLETLELTGEPFMAVAGGSAPSVSADGTLVHLMGASGLFEMVWADRDGSVGEIVGQQHDRIWFPALSPDERRVAVVGIENNNSDIWIHDIERGTKTRLTFDESRQIIPAWSPSGEEIAYLSLDEGTPNLKLQSADGSGEARILAQGGNPSFSADGRYLAYDHREEDGNFGLFYRTMDEEGESVPFLDTEADERTPRISPDGRFLAYRSDESGRAEIYIKRFPSSEGKWQVSVEGGVHPRWNGSGDELFYVEGSFLMAVPVETEPALRLGTPQRLFSWSPSWILSNIAYEVTDDGTRFLLVRPVGSASDEESIRIVENWASEFRAEP
jgi:serine/threonine protein kinase